ncbi:12668_t:CDS:2 [Ambispora gerdemannii]|uniref:12665_t:CDS:1 n=1 Tax=Ambispora gerdemannii TaxID=144530 RepID=A0A9N9BAE4_9GLOM|nr:12665_t:CDS:2 [Ambispora gerdemannii]CAG8559040.1 12668_t:CDS:2 [Ambispora gerdemannii]
MAKVTFDCKLTYSRQTNEWTFAWKGTGLHNQPLNARGEGLENVERNSQKSREYQRKSLRNTQERFERMSGRNRVVLGVLSISPPSTRQGRVWRTVDASPPSLLVPCSTLSPFPPSFLASGP